jgi:hypothetical protein
MPAATAQSIKSGRRRGILVAVRKIQGDFRGVFSGAWQLKRRRAL